MDTIAPLITSTRLSLPEVPAGSTRTGVVSLELDRWIARTALLTRADSITWIDGTDDQRAEIVEAAHGEPHDVAMLEGSWLDKVEAVARPGIAEQATHEDIAESMRGTTMFVVPYLVEADGDRAVGVLVTDSPNLVVQLVDLGVTGDSVLELVTDKSRFDRTLHVSGRPPRHRIGQVPSPRAYVDEAGHRVWAIGGAVAGAATRILAFHNDAVVVL